MKKKKKRIQKQCKKIEKQCKKDLGGLIERQGKRPNPSPGSHMSLSHNALDASSSKYQKTTSLEYKRKTTTLQFKIDTYSKVQQICMVVTN